MTFACTHCGITFDRKKTKSVLPTNPFCSHNCFREHQQSKWKCRICYIKISKRRLYCDQHRKQMRPRIVSPYSSVKQRRQRIKERAVEHKGGACSICGYNRCLRSLEFHHTDPTQKDFTIANNTGRSWNDILSELDKCILVCSNCHGEIHDGMTLVGDKRIELLFFGNQPKVLPLN